MPYGNIRTDSPTSKVRNIDLPSATIKSDFPTSSIDSDYPTARVSHKSIVSTTETTSMIMAGTPLGLLLALTYATDQTLTNVSTTVKDLSPGIPTARIRTT